MLTLAACNSGGGSSNNTPKTPSAKEGATISSLVLQAGDETHDVSISGTTGKATLPYDTDTDDLTIDTITISEGATANFGTEEDPGAEATNDATIPALDENNQFKITVTAKDGTTTNPYTITIETEPNDKAELQQLHVRVGSTDYTVDIRADNKTGDVRVPHGTTSLIIGIIKVSDKATASLRQGDRVEVSESNEFSIMVTAENSTTADYTIIVTIAPAINDQAELTNLSLALGDESYPATLSQAETGGTGDVNIPYGSDLDSLTIGRIEISDDATADTTADASVSLNGNKQFTITVTAEDGTTTAGYIITIDDTPTLAVTGHYDEQRIGAGDFSKDNLLQIGNVQNGEWNYSISVTGTNKSDTSSLPIDKTGDATASDSSFAANPLTAVEWNMFHDTSPDNLPLLTVDITLWRSGEDKPTESTGSLANIAKEQYLLKSWQDVQAINHDLSGDYTLMHDITFPEPGTDGMTTAGFEPIGNRFTGFRGNLYGNNKVLRNFYINRPTENYTALVAKLLDGSIFDLGIVLRDVPGQYGITGSGTVAGLAGEGFGNSRVENSYVKGRVKGKNNIGGLIGHALYNTVVSHSYTSGSVTSNSSRTGGLVGQVGTSGTHQVKLINSYSSSNVIGGTGVGGLIGDLADIEGDGIIINTYATGDVSGDNQVGALIGEVGSEGSFTKSYAVGLVSSTGSAGGLLGFLPSWANVMVSHSYWDTQTTMQATSVGSDATTFGRTTAQMKMQSTFDAAGDNTADWDFTTDWGIDASINNGYPYLRGVGEQPADAKQLLVLDLRVNGSNHSVTIDESAKTGAVQLPAGTDLTSITIERIFIAGASVSQHGANGASLYRRDLVTLNSSNQFTVTVTDANDATQNYTITVTLQ